MLLTRSLAFTFFLIFSTDYVYLLRTNITKTNSLCVEINLILILK